MLFDPQIHVDAKAEVEALRRSGADPQGFYTIRQATDLTKLSSGEAYLYIVGIDGFVHVAPEPSKKSIWTHVVLGKGGAVQAAGTLRVSHQSGILDKVTIDQSSSAYCPLESSLNVAVRSLTAAQIPNDTIRVENRPAPNCGAAKPADNAKLGSGLGSVMSDIARRMELLGRALQARNWNLATYKVGELEEAFGEDVPKASLPPMPKSFVLAPLLQSTVTSLSSLRGALRSPNVERDAKDAFADLAASCNGCHNAAAKPFLRISSRPGERVPRVGLSDAEP